jgi:hypothetical protein
VRDCGLPHDDEDSVPMYHEADMYTTYEAMPPPGADTATGPLRWRLGNEMVKRRWNGLTLFNFMDKDKRRNVAEAEFIDAILSMGICTATKAEIRLLWREARYVALNLHVPCRMTHLNPHICRPCTVRRGWQR